MCEMEPSQVKTGDKSYELVLGTKEESVQE